MVGRVGKGRGLGHKSWRIPGGRGEIKSTAVVSDGDRDNVSNTVTNPRSEEPKRIGPAVAIGIIEVPGDVPSNRPVGLVGVVGDEHRALTIGIGDLAKPNKPVDGPFTGLIFEPVGIKVIQIEKVGRRREIQASVDSSKRVVERCRRCCPSGPLLLILKTIEIAQHHGGGAGAADAVSGKIVASTEENSVVERVDPLLNRHRQIINQVRQRRSAGL